MRVGSTLAAAALVVGLSSLQSVSGQESGTVTIDVGDCVELESPEARRACFGAQVDQVLEARGVVEADRERVTEDGEADRDLGTVDEAPREAEPSSRSASEAGRDESAESAETAESAESAESADDAQYFGTITAMRERVPSSYVITLDNGQVWEQVEPKRYPLRPGLEVRIYPTRWGDRYRLSGVGTGGHIQVRRVQ